MGNAVEILSTSRGMVIVNDGINLGRAKLREDRGPVKEPEHHCAVLTFQRNESSETEYQRVRVHRERKRSLGHRLVVLRNYIKRCYGDDWVNDSSHWNELEDWLDCALLFGKAWQDASVNFGSCGSRSADATAFYQIYLAVP